MWSRRPRNQVVAAPPPTSFSRRQFLRRGFALLLVACVMMMTALRAFAGHDGGRTARSCDSCLSVHNRCCPKRALRYYISFSAGCIQPDAGSGAADGGQMFTRWAWCVRVWTSCPWANHVTASLLHGQKMAVMSLLVPVSTRGRARAHTVSDTGKPPPRRRHSVQRLGPFFPFSPLLASGFL